MAGGSVVRAKLASPGFHGQFTALNFSFFHNNLS